MRVLKGARVVLGVTGGIAAFKAVELASRLVKAGAMVEVIMTEGATRFVAPLSFQAITQRPVYVDMFQLLREAEIGHVSLAEAADILAIVPATANTIAKLALGIADNFLTATALATKAPILIAPAMHTGMFENPATQENLARLGERGVVLVGPVSGRLASGGIGMGRMEEPEAILEHIRIVLGRKGDLAGRRVVVTAGGTREPIDPVRYVGNHSSGKMGYRLAEAARDRGAEVSLISGATSERIPRGVKFIPVGTASEMAAAVEAEVAGADVLLMAAAVADYAPVSPAAQKIKKGEGELVLRLVRTVDILASLPPHAGLVKVGFAAETEDLVANATKKLKAKALDLIVGNPVPAAFGADQTEATLISRDGTATALGVLPKEEAAEQILDRVVELLKG